MLRALRPVKVRRSASLSTIAATAAARDACSSSPQMLPPCRAGDSCWPPDAIRCVRKEAGGSAAEGDAPNSIRGTLRSMRSGGVPSCGWGTRPTAAGIRAAGAIKSAPRTLSSPATPPSVVGAWVWTDMPLQCPSGDEPTGSVGVWVYEPTGSVWVYEPTGSVCVHEPTGSVCVHEPTGSVWV
eukprot:5271761-Prymnesium_polylepis.2